MSRHLSPEESVAALERTLDAAGRAHLEGCEDCRREVAALEAMWREAKAADHGFEPSPLFWDHFSTRVRKAVRAEASARRTSGRRVWQPALALAAALLLMVWLSGRDPGRPGSAPIEEQVAGVAVSPADLRWDAVMELAAELSVEDVHEAVPLRFESVMLFDELTADEQAALSGLLADELRGLE